MCGIIGYIGKKPAAPILLAGLRRLEYRGYDSAGVAILETDNGLWSMDNSQKVEVHSPKSIVHRVRAVGKIDNLAEKLKGSNLSGTMGIAHTRWATHGGVTEANAHPHMGADGKLVIVHNGIVENYRELRKAMESTVKFESDTDTEILAHLIASRYRGDLRAAVLSALPHVRGTYGLVVMHADDPDKLIAARKGCPIVLGVGNDEQYVASDPTPLLMHTKKCIFLNDGEVAELTRTGIETYNLADEQVVKCVEELDWDEAKAEKAGFRDFMLKEIHDQPLVFQDAIRGRYNLAEGTSYMGGLNMTDEEIRSVKRVILLACGTASYAAMVGKYAFERLAGIPTEVDVGSEFRYRDPIIDDHTLVFGISQSGETADTLAALREAKRKGAFVRGIINVVGSTIARETGGGSYIHAGPELAVASTKAYTNMVAVLILYALQFGRLNRVSVATGQRVLSALLEIPEKMKQILKTEEDIKRIAVKYAHYKDFFFLGRGVNFPVALEGSLKLKEITYIHSEAYPGGEMKHGPIALLSPDFPVFAIMPHDQLYDKMRSNVEEIRARKAPVIILATAGDESVRDLAEDVLYVSETMELLQPLLSGVVLQLFAYHVAVALGRDVDRPRNLAKSVTVE